MKGKAAPASEPATTRVEISAGGHQVVVESTDPLNTVARKALDLWRATDSPEVVRGMSTSVGFTTDIAALPPALMLPDQLDPGGPDEHRRSRRR